jgi:hypothetical protein
MTQKQAEDFRAKLDAMTAQHETYQAILKDGRTPTQAEEDAEDAAWAELLELAREIF